MDWLEDIPGCFDANPPEHDRWLVEDFASSQRLLEGRLPETDDYHEEAALEVELIPVKFMKLSHALYACLQFLMDYKEDADLFLEDVEDLGESDLRRRRVLAGLLDRWDIKSDVRYAIMRAFELGAGIVQSSSFRASVTSLRHRISWQRAPIAMLISSRQTQPSR